MEITELEAKALSIDDLKDMQSKPIKYVMYDDLRDMDYDELWSEGPMCIILLDIHNGRDIEPVGHWVALLNYDSHIEHFDSYGLSLDQELSFTHDGPYLTNILKGKTVVENGEKLQKFRDQVNTCGRWCIVRCNEYNRNIHDFVEWIHNIPCEPDIAVTLLTTYPGGTS